VVVLLRAKSMGVCTVRMNISCLCVCLCFDMPTPAYLASNSGTRAVGLIGLTAMDIVQFITIVRSKTFQTKPGNRMDMSCASEVSGGGGGVFAWLEEKRNEVAFTSLCLFSGCLSKTILAT